MGKPELVLCCILAYRLLVHVCSLQLVSPSSGDKPTDPSPSVQEQRVVTSCGNPVMRRNWHEDEIRLALFSDLKECSLTDLIYMQTLADALIHTTL